MKAFRVDGSGIDYTDQRIVKVSGIIKSLGLSNLIYEIKDRKGELIVLWKELPSEVDWQIIDKVWSHQEETYTQHFLCEVKEINTSM